VAQLCDRIILINEGRVIREKALPDIMASHGVYRLRIRTENELPAIPHAVQVKRLAENTYELETRSRQTHLDLLTALPRGRVQILMVETREASLEDYFVEALEQKLS
jgi:ABC-type uncharacterized transport system ATPase subunit